jgi:hypothetical protein
MPDRRHDFMPPEDDDPHLVERAKGFIEEEPEQVERLVCGGRGYRDFQDDDCEEWGR